MNTVVLVGKVSDRPFRPGGGERVVAKMTVTEDGGGRTNLFEFDAFGEIGKWVMSNLWVGDLVSLQGRLEQRVYRDQGEEVEETRVVAQRVNFVMKGNRPPRDQNRDHRDGRDGRDPNRVDESSVVDPNRVEAGSDHVDDVDD